jgi:hypothetical protein
LSPLGRPRKKKLNTEVTEGPQRKRRRRDGIFGVGVVEERREEKAYAEGAEKSGEEKPKSTGRSDCATSQRRPLRKAAATKADPRKSRSLHGGPHKARASGTLGARGKRDDSFLGGPQTARHLTPLEPRAGRGRIDYCWSAALATVKAAASRRTPKGKPHP